MNKNYIALALLICANVPLVAMWEQASGQKKKSRYNVYFETTVVITSDAENAQKVLEQYAKPYNGHHHALGCAYYECDGTCYKTPTHPLISAGLKPYQHGNGGLLNPILKEYTVTPMAVDKGTQVTIKGCVEINGIAPYTCNSTHYGQSSNNDETIKHMYELNKLEEAILGALIERSTDRRVSDTTSTYFDHGSFTKKFFTCVKEEWSSQLDENDNGTRSCECTDLIKRYFARSAYWPSQWYLNAKNERRGRYDGKLLQKRHNDTSIKIELTNFHVSVEKAKKS